MMATMDAMADKLRQACRFELLSLAINAISFSWWNACHLTNLMCYFNLP
jgi:hypothetical protein